MLGEVIAGFFKPGDRVAKRETVVVPKPVQPTVIVNDGEDEEPAVKVRNIEGQEFQSRIDRLDDEFEEREVAKALAAMEKREPSKSTKEDALMTRRLPVFVYGTLKRGCSNHDVVKEYVEDISTAKLAQNKFMLYSGPAFPALLEAEYSQPWNVVGQLITLRPADYEKAMASLDALEGTKSGFYRRIMTVAVIPRNGVYTDPEAVPCWVYVAGTQLRARAIKSWTKINDGIWDPKKELTVD